MICLVARMIKLISGGDIDAALGRMDVTYNPPMVPGEGVGECSYNMDVGTAGSITLIMQALLPVLVFERRDSPVLRLSLTGGTDVSFSPPMDHFARILLPLLQNMGVQVSVQAMKRGYFPVGGGRLDLEVARLGVLSLTPLQLVSRGAVLGARAMLHGAGPGVSATVLGALRRAVEEMVAQFLLRRPNLLAAGSVGGVEWLDDGDGDLGDTHTTDDPGDEGGRGGAPSGQGRKRRRGKGGRDSTLGVQVWLSCSSGALLGANCMCCDRDLSRFQDEGLLSSLTDDLERRLALVVDSGACIDEHTADQLVVYMALAAGESRLLVAPRDPQESSLHLESALRVAKIFSECEYSIELIEETGCRLVTCSGINYTSSSR
jgi:RNA 3'-terminal phosphate cyclase (ATP)